jgi:hypothetical protein
LNILGNDGVYPSAWDDDGFFPPTLWWSALSVTCWYWSVKLRRIMIGESYP